MCILASKSIAIPIIPIALSEWKDGIDSEFTQEYSR